MVEETKMASSDKRNQASPSLLANWESKGAQIFFWKLHDGSFCIQSSFLHFGLVMAYNWRSLKDTKWQAMGAPKPIGRSKEHHDTESVS